MQLFLRELHMPLVRRLKTSFGVTRNRRIVLARYIRRADRLGRVHRGRTAVLLWREHRHRVAGDGE